MRVKVMNVTMPEFANIKLASDRMEPADFAKFMHEWYRCGYYVKHVLIVRKDVPLIPWMSANVSRFEDRQVEEAF